MWLTNSWQTPTEPSQDDRQQVELAAAFVRSRLSSQGLDQPPASGIILGSGLGNLASEVTDAISIPFAEIPGFAVGTAAGHRSQLVVGTLEGQPVMMLAGRLHLYEGWSVQQVTFPVRVMAALGIRMLIVSNAAGGLRPWFRVGDIMVIRDSINRLPSSGLRWDPLTSTRFPYDRQLGDFAMAVGRQYDFTVHQGVYLATLGPTYETRAEYRMMRRLGADSVGMSTVPEVLQAAHCGIRVLALSMISNVARPDAAVETTHEEVLDAGREAAPRMRRLVTSILQRF